MEFFLRKDLPWVYLPLQTISDYAVGKIKTGSQVQPEVDLEGRIDYTFGNCIQIHLWG